MRIVTALQLNNSPFSQFVFVKNFAKNCQTHQFRISFPFSHWTQLKFKNAQKEFSEFADSRQRQSHENFNKIDTTVEEIWKR